MRNFYKPQLGGHPLLSGHLGRSRGCRLNKGFTVIGPVSSNLVPRVLSLRKWEGVVGKRQSQRRIDQPMAGPFPPLPFSEGKGLGNKVELSRGCLDAPAVLLSNAGGSRRPDDWRLSTPVQSSYINSLMNGAFCDEIII